MTTPDTQSALPTPPEPLDRASLIRAGADEQLPADDRAAFDSLCASDATTLDRVAFEQALRRSVSRVMSTPAHAPASLRAAVATLIDEENAVVGSAQTRHRSFWSKRNVWASIAAAIVLITAVSIVSTTPWRGAGAPAGQPFAAQLLNASTFVVSEHSRCSSFGSYFDRKFTVRDVNDAPTQAASLLGASPATLALDLAGYQFVGSGKCSVPGPGVSMHILYKPIDPARPTLSFFVQQNTRPEELDQSVRYRLTTDNGAPVLVWGDDHLIYYVFCPDTIAALQAARMLNAPDLEQAI